MFKIVTASILILLNFGCTLISPAIGISTIYNATKFDKVGTSKAIKIFGVFEYGDRGVSTAMKNGGIYFIHHVDAKVENYIFFSRMITMVYGEAERPSQKELKRISDVDSVASGLLSGDNIQISLINGNTIKAIADRTSSTAMVIYLENGAKQIIRLQDILYIKKMQ